MRADIDIDGVLISSFAAYALAAFGVLFLLRRLVFARVRLGRFVANAPLAEVGFYLCILSLLIGFI